MTIMILRPNAAGDETSIPGQYPDSTYHWDKVDEAVADDNDYVFNSTEDGEFYRDLYALPAPPSTAGIINKVTVHFRAKTTTWGYIKPSLKSNGTVTDGNPVHLLIGEWANYSQEWVANPADGETWEWSDIDGLQMGISLEDFSRVGGPWTTYCSQVYVEIDLTYVLSKTEIKTEATATSGEIALTGGKKTLGIDNHLIQTSSGAQTIADAYLIEYKDQKTKLVVERPTPAPYEIGDTVERISAKLPYRDVSTALINYADVADAIHYYNLAGRDMIIRKLNVSFSAGNYISTIELED